MGDITAPRIEALSQSLDLDKRFVKQGQLRKREKPGNPSGRETARQARADRVEGRYCV